MNIELQTENRILDGFFEFPLPMERVLYEVEQPLIYLTKNKQGQDMLAYFAYEADDYQFTIVAPVTKKLISLLESGKIGVREVLTGSWMWAIRENVALGIFEAWSITEDAVPVGYLPNPGTLLLPEHRIALDARAV